jgi:fumarate hydratase class II
VTPTPHSSQPAAQGDHRIERDSFGDIAVPAARLWGAQTQRSLQHFPISTERMPGELIQALALIKRACATVNASLGRLDAAKARAIEQAADEVLAGLHAQEFPLSVWQTGSGTQSNMNVNEVLANRASELLGGPRGLDRLVHPNDEVNSGQSSNDVFPTAMHVAAATFIRAALLPSLQRLRATLAAKAHAFAPIVKIGRTHLQDATPLTLGQEFSGYVAQLDAAQRAIEGSLGELFELAIGGAGGNFELNVYKPLIAHGFLQSVRMLADAMRTFNDYCAAGIEPNRGRIEELLQRSLMLVTALAPHIGYDRAAEIAKKAHREGTTLKEAALALGYVSADDFDRWVDPAGMV